jgi:glycosyltransferase involved in cell wall biosynthesis
MADATVLAHHWLFEPRGGERVLAELAAIFPQAPILTAFVEPRPRGWPDAIAALVPRARASRLQPLYQAARSCPPLWPLLLPLLPWGMRGGFGDVLRSADRLLISDAGLAKLIADTTGLPAAVYLHSPMRHIWHDAEQTERQLPAALRPVARVIIEALRKADRRAAGRVGAWAANSQTTARRASDCYGIERAAITVIHPPVSIPARAAAAEPRSGLLVVSGMQPYKNDLLAVQAAARLGLPLTVVGDGPVRRRLEAAAGPQTRFLGYQSDAEVDGLYRSSAALLFAGVEDFGIVPVEAIARGCPVVALAAGGCLETVTEGETGVFFAEPSVEGCVEAIDRCLSLSWDPVVMHEQSGRFSPDRFCAAVRAWLPEWSS